MNVIFEEYPYHTVHIIKNEWGVCENVQFSKKDKKIQKCIIEEFVHFMFKTQMFWSHTTALCEGASQNAWSPLSIVYDIWIAVHIEVTFKQADFCWSVHLNLSEILMGFQNP